MLTEKSFNTGVLSINYAEGPPNGMPFVLLHGVIGRWQDLTPLITELEKRWHVYACDERGHGKSGRAASYRVIDFYPDTATFIKQQIGAPTVLLGHSGGAIVALGVAAQIPELIRALILLDPPIFLGDEGRRKTAVNDYFSGVYDILNHQKTTREMLSDLIPDIDEERIQHHEEAIRSVDPAFVKFLVEDRYFDDLDIQDILENVVCPTLLLYGEIEKGSVLSNREIEFFLDHIPNGEARQIKNTGHLLQIDQPARVLELIDGWIENLE